MADRNRPIITLNLCLGRAVAGRQVKTKLTCNVPFLNHAARDKGSREIEAALKVLDKYEIFSILKYEHDTEIIELREDLSTTLTTKDPVEELTTQAEKVSLQDNAAAESDSRG